MIMPHQHGLGEALGPVLVASLCLHLLGNVLEDISDLMLYLELVLDVFLTPGGNEILYIPNLLVACLGLAGGSKWDGFIHVLQQCP